MIGAGQSIGNYRVLSKLGTGGMGAVYLAEHPLIGKRVALKVIHHELATNKEVVQRFFQEAKAVNQIGNEHVVEIHDFGMTPDGDHFYIMEYLEGKTLASVLAKHVALDVMRALHVSAQIASALQAAHQNGVIHRDLKPDNIMLISRLGDPDFVKVLDFGLAKMFAAGASAVKTAHGVLLGTPQYMSPEACESKQSIDHRTDIYALGVLMFQMLTGVLPFDGESMGEVLVKQVTALPPAPRGLNPSIPPSVEQILLRCLAKSPDARFPTMQVLRDALKDPEAYLRSAPPIAPARSVAPGEAKVDAKTVMAHAAMLEQQKQAAQQKTRIADPNATKILPPGGPADVNPALSALAPPQVPNQHTMQIGTPFGYSSAPPRKVWPIVLVLGLVLGLGGGAFAVAWVRSDDGDKHHVATGDGSGSATPGGSATSGGSGSAKPVAVDAPVALDAAPPKLADASSGSGTPDAGSGEPAMVKLVLESTPPGATVYAPDGTLLGKTRLALEWPISTTAVTFELRLPGFKRKLKQIVVSGDMTVGVELERGSPVGVPNPGRGSGSAKKGSGDGLMRPGD